jgi:hypothetical protein
MVRALLRSKTVFGWVVKGYSWGKRSFGSNFVTTGSSEKFGLFKNSSG